MKMVSFVVGTLILVCVQLSLAQGNPAKPPQPSPPPNNQQNPKGNAGPNNPPGQNPQPPQGPNSAPGQNPAGKVEAPLSPPLNADGEVALTSQGVGRRDPFTLPLYLINKMKAQNQGPPPSRIDDSVEPIRRWPLVSYNLVGIIWDVKNAKALIKDQAGHVHILRVKDRIGYDNGVITDIREGSVTVLENQIPQVLRLKK